MRRALSYLVEDLREKAKLYYHDESAKSVAKALAADGSGAMVLYRLMQGARDAKLPALEAAFYKMNALTGCIIGRGAEFGPGFVLRHSNGIVINGAVRGGNRVHLQHQVTIGNNEREEAPTLGNDIVVGAGAKVIGNVKVGDGARVGANAVVVHDVEADSTVVGIPAKKSARRGGAAAPKPAPNPNDN